MKIMILPNVNIANKLMTENKSFKIYAKKKKKSSLDVSGFIVLTHSLAKDVPNT